MKKEALLLVFLFFVPFVLGASPVAYINETATVDFKIDGTLDNLSGTGYVEVETPNSADVLQFLRLNLSGINSTNLQSEQSYRHVAVSPLAGYRTRMFLRTNNSEKDLEYTINSTANLKRVNLELDYFNVEGGTSLSFNKTSVYMFRLFLNSEIDVNPINITIRTKKDTFMMNDSMNITQAFSSEPGYAVDIIDSDSDGWNDFINLSGSITANQTVTITFTSTLTPDLNYNDTELLIDLDDSFSISTVNTYNDTLTGVRFTDKFARGPIREGITVIPLDPPEGPRIRGFIKNVAIGLNYTVDRWDLYEISDLVNPVLSSANYTLLNPSDTLYTMWYEAPVGSTPYYTADFDWRVQWINQSFSGMSMSRVRLPTLSGMEIFGDKSISFHDACPTSQTIHVTDAMKHIGSVNAGIDLVEFNSTVPHKSEENRTNAWSISNVRVWYENTTGTYEITSLVNYTTLNPTSSSDGYVYFNFSALSVINHTVNQNERVILNYSLTASPIDYHSQFVFDADFKATVTEGTSYTDAASISALVCACVEDEEPEPPGGGGGGGGGGPSKPPSRFDIIKEYSDIYMVEGRIAEVEVIDGIVARGGLITNSGVFIYVPVSNDLHLDSVNIMTYDSSEDRWSKLINGLSFKIEDKGVDSIGEMQFKSYLITKIGEDWEYDDRDKIRIKYLVNVTQGTNYVLTRVYGTTPKSEKIFEDAYTPIRLAVGPGVLPEAEFEIKEGEWEQEERVDVGKPVLWIKPIEIYNPNEENTKGVFGFDVFSDILNAYLIEDGVRKDLNIQKIGDDAFIKFEDMFKPGERKIYFIEAMTPPIVDTKRELSVLEINETSALFKLNITLNNTALEDYNNIFYVLPGDYEEVISISDNFGEINYTDFIRLDWIDGKGKKNIIVIYREKIPIIDPIVDPQYFCDSPINYTVFVVPSATGKDFYVEAELLGPEQRSTLAYAELISLGDVEVGKQVRIPRSFGVSRIPSGNYRLVTRLRKDFITIKSKEREFFIDCQTDRGICWIWLLFLLLMLITLYRFRCDIRKVPLKVDVRYLEYLLGKIDRILKEEKYFIQKKSGNLIDPAKLTLAVKLFDKARMTYTGIVKEYKKWLAAEQKCVEGKKKRCCKLYDSEKKEYGRRILWAYKELMRLREDLVTLIGIIKNRKEEYLRKKGVLLEKEIKKKEPVKKLPTKKESGFAYYLDDENNVTTMRIRRYGDEEGTKKKIPIRDDTDKRIRHIYYYMDGKGKITKIEAAKFGRKIHSKREIGRIVDSKGHSARLWMRSRMREPGHLYLDKERRVVKIDELKKRKKRLFRRNRAEEGDLLAKICIDRKPGHLYYIDESGKIITVKSARGLKWAD